MVPLVTPQCSHYFCNYFCVEPAKKYISVQLLSRVQFFAPPWSAALQASLSITSSQNLPKLMPIESVMPSNHLILCRPLFPLLSIFPIILRCAGKAGNPFQTTQGNRLSCRDQEGKRGSEEAVPGVFVSHLSVFFGEMSI